MQSSLWLCSTKETHMNVDDLTLPIMVRLVKSFYNWTTVSWPRTSYILWRRYLSSTAGDGTKLQRLVGFGVELLVHHEPTRIHCWMLWANNPDGPGSSLERHLHPLWSWKIFWSYVCCVIRYFFVGVECLLHTTEDTIAVPLILDRQFMSLLEVVLHILGLHLEDPSHAPTSHTSWLNDTINQNLDERISTPHVLSHEFVWGVYLLKYMCAIKPCPVRYPSTKLHKEYICGSLHYESGCPYLDQAWGV